MPTRAATNATLRRLVERYRPRSAVETADLARLGELLGGDPWSRDTPLHVTGSAFVVHPPSGRVLLRWHERQEAWLQVGGHGDPGETDPLDIALREGREETGLDDLSPLEGSAEPIHVVVVSVRPRGAEPAHEHLDIRYVLRTSHPEAMVAESETAPLRWVEPEQAEHLVGRDNARETLRRLRPLLAGEHPGRLTPG